MPDFETLIYESLDDGRICRITFNRPEKMNALSRPLLRELDVALHDAEGDPDVRVVILCGAGRAFSAGYDLSPSPDTGQQRIYSGEDPQGRRLIGGRISTMQITDLQLYLWNMAKVTIAQVHGYALAGGCEFAMMADLVIAADDAQFGHPGTRGVGTPGNGNLWPLLIPMRHAKELIYTGDSTPAARAEALNMINKAVPGEQLEEYTLTLARRIGNQDGDSLAIHKHMLNRFHEHQGIYPALRSATDYGAMYRFTNFAYKWNDKIQAAMTSGGGLKEALAWRDGPYKT